MDVASLVELGFLESPILLAIFSAIVLPYLKRKMESANNQALEIAMQTQIITLLPIDRHQALKTYDLYTKMGFNSWMTEWVKKEKEKQAIMEGK